MTDKNKKDFEKELDILLDKYGIKHSIFATSLNEKYIIFSKSDTEDEIAHTRLTGSAKTTDKINLFYEMNNLGVYLDIKKYNDYFGANEGRLNVNTDYTIADLRLNYKLSKTLEWFTGIDNIQDKQMPYNMTSRGTPNDPGERFYYTGMKISFE